MQHTYILKLVAGAKYNVTRKVSDVMEYVSSDRHCLGCSAGVCLVVPA